MIKFVEPEVAAGEAIAAAVVLTAPLTLTLAFLLARPVLKQAFRLYLTMADIAAEVRAERSPNIRAGRSATGLSGQGRPGLAPIREGAMRECLVLNSPRCASL